jgi:branched-chain amino acid transport system substrate-binding protein
MTQSFWNKSRFGLLSVACGAALLLLSACEPTGAWKQTPPAPPSPAIGSALPAPYHAPAMPSTPAMPQPQWQGDAPATIVKVGLLLPLSGQAASMGQAMRDAAVLALFDKYASQPNHRVRVELITKDTMGTEDGARAAAAAAVKEGATLILGPLFTSSVEAIRPLASTGQITIISFSNRKEVAGGGVYLMGFDPAEQAQRVARYAYMQDMQGIAAFVPSDAYGNEVLRSFGQVAELLGRRLQPVVRYAPASGALSQEIRTLAVEGSTGARFHFRGLFLPEGGDKLGEILAGLRASNISSQTIQFIGTGLWDDKNLIRNHDLNGAWLASAPPEGVEAFEQRYVATYGSTPPRLASLAYDAVALATTLAEASPDGRISRAQIEQPQGFYGPANGIFRFAANGHIERGLAVLQVDGNRGLRVIDPAPTRFR